MSHWLDQLKMTTYLVREPGAKIVSISG